MLHIILKLFQYRSLFHMAYSRRYYNDVHTLGYEPKIPIIIFEKFYVGLKFLTALKQKQKLSQNLSSERFFISDTSDRTFKPVGPCSVQWRIDCFVKGKYACRFFSGMYFDTFMHINLHKFAVFRQKFSLKYNSRFLNSESRRSSYLHLKCSKRFFDFCFTTFNSFILFEAKCKTLCL